VAPVAAPAVAPVPPVDDTGAGNGSAATIAIGLALALVAIAAGLALWRRRIASASPARPAAAGAGIATATTATLAGPATETRRGGAKPKRSRSAARRARRRRAAEPPAERPVADRGRPVAGLSSEALGTSIAAAGTGSKRRGSRKAHRAAERRGSGAGGQRERELIAHASTPLNGQGIGRVAVISRKGGVGKTTTTLMLGHMLAKHRLDRVLALDGNPDAGSLGFRVKRETDATVTELLAARDEIKRYADIRRFTNLAPSGLEVIAGDDDPRITNALREEDYRKITELLERHYNLLCMDTGTGVLESANRGIIQIADQVVVVMGSSVDSGRVASSTLDWLEQNGHSDLVSEAVAVINMGRGDGLVDVGKLAEHFGARCRAVVMVPWDPQLAAGAEAGIEDLAPETRLAYLELAAAVGVGFGRLAPAG
jgi:putative peptide zinc metalloprotease protein